MTILIKYGCCTCDELVTRKLEMHLGSNTRTCLYELSLGTIYVYVIHIVYYQYGYLQVDGHRSLLFASFLPIQSPRSLSFFMRVTNRDALRVYWFVTRKSSEFPAHEILQSSMRYQFFHQRMSLFQDIPRLKYLSNMTVWKDIVGRCSLWKTSFSIGSGEAGVTLT